MDRLFKSYSFPIFSSTWCSASRPSSSFSPFLRRRSPSHLQIRPFSADPPSRTVPWGFLRHGASSTLVQQTLIPRPLSIGHHKSPPPLIFSDCALLRRSKNLTTQFNSRLSMSTPSPFPPPKAVCVTSSRQQIPSPRPYTFLVSMPGYPPSPGPPQNVFFRSASRPLFNLRPLPTPVSLSPSLPVIHQGNPPPISPPPCPFLRAPSGDASWQLVRTSFSASSHCFFPSSRAPQESCNDLAFFM